MATGIANVKGSGIGSNLLTTTTDATFINQTYELALSYLSNTPKVNDYVAYVDSDLIKTLYKITAISSGTATLSLVGNFATGGGTSVIANPTLAGTEDELTGLQVGDTKYKVGGGKRYLHSFRLAGSYSVSGETVNLIITMERTTNVQFTKETFMTWLWNNGFKGSSSQKTYCSCVGIASNGDLLSGIGFNSSNTETGSFQAFIANLYTNQQLSGTSLNYLCAVYEIPVD